MNKYTYRDETNPFLDAQGLISGFFIISSGKPFLLYLSSKISYTAALAKAIVFSVNGCTFSDKLLMKSSNYLKLLLLFIKNQKRKN